MNDEAEDRFFDVMLGEAVGRAAPPDLSPQILTKLAAQPKMTVAHGRRSKRSTSRRIWGWSPLLLAAAVLLALGSFFWRSFHNPENFDNVPVEIADRGTDATDPDPNTQQRSSPEMTRATVPEEALAEDRARRVPQADPSIQADHGFAIGLDDLPFGPRAKVDSDVPLPESTPRKAVDRLSGAEIVRRLNRLIDAGWRSMNIQPQQEATTDAIAGRLASTVRGRTKIESSDTRLAQQLQRERVDETALEYVREDSATRNLGIRWASLLLGKSAWQRLTARQRREIGELVTASFRGQQGYDSIVVRLLTAEGSATPDDPGFKPETIWMAGLAGEQSIPLTNQFCNVMLDLDVTCARCHHHPLERDVAQADYWKLNAIFQTGLRWQLGGKGHLRIAKSDNPNRSGDVVFYDSPDRRRMVASPGVATDWLQNEAIHQPPTDLSNLARDLTQGDRFARATVNGLWTLLYGNRLVGRTSDPLAPPLNENFVAARDLLAEQLREYQYDLGAATAWMIAARPMQFGSAIDHFDADSLVVSEEELLAADLQQRAFAAYSSPLRDWSFDELVAVADKFNGGSGNRTLRAPSVLLAQTAAEPSGNREGPPKKSQRRLRDEALLRSLAGSAATGEPPAGWLHSVESGFEQQARHLFYVGGIDRPNKRQLESAMRIRESADSDEVALQQLWWAIRLSKGSP